MTFVATFEPTGLWSHFDEILTIPRGSKNEERMRTHVTRMAERCGLPCRVDTAGNVVVTKPGTAGREGVGATILQAHLDMVNEKNADVTHDFMRDPIIPVLDGDYLKATGTTLGSDNGIGVATMLALMESADVAHGPLELLFTIDEETGLTGAAQLDTSLLTGRRLINLDSEEEGVVYVGCAGGGDSTLTLRTKAATPPADTVALSIRLRGLKGGHSGCDIHLQRGNAIKLLTRALRAAHRVTPFLVERLEGGNAHNAIPREASAVVVVASEVRERLVAAVRSETAAFQAETRGDPDMNLEIDDVELPSSVWEAKTTSRVLNLVASLPHGVVRMSHEIPELVETSTNLATVRVHAESIEIGMSSRSSVATAIVALRGEIRAVAELAGATVEEDDGYPGWQPDLTSALLGTVKQVHAGLFGSEPAVKAIHAGLECGIIGEKIPGTDMVSIGPQIEFPHSPDERVHVASVGRFYRWLTATLGALT